MGKELAAYAPLQHSIIEVADTIGVIDELVGKVINYLNRRKRTALISAVEKLERETERLEVAEGQMRQRVEQLQVAVDDLRGQRVGVLPHDILLLGLSYVFRKGSHKRDLSRAENRLNDCVAQIDEIRVRGAALRSKTEKLEQQLSQQNPSFWARVLTVLLFLKNLISAVVNLLVGRVLSALLSMKALIPA